MAESAQAKTDKPSKHLAWLAPAGIVVALATLNCAILWWYPSPPNDLFEVAFFGIWAFQPLLLGTWTALGAGRLVTRAPLVIPCLMLVIVTPSVVPKGFNDVERSEFLVITGVGFAMLAAMSAIMYLVRWFTGWRILISRQATFDQLRLQFDIKYLLVLITLYAVSLAVISRMEFEPPEASPFFGPDFFLHVAAVGGSAIAAILLPIISVPLFVLMTFASRRFVLLSAGFWVLVTTVMATIGTVLDGTSFAETVMWIILMQSSAAILGVCVALALRVTGYRLISIKSREPRVETGQP